MTSVGLHTDLSDICHECFTILSPIEEKSIGRIMRSPTAKWRCACCRRELSAKAWEKGHTLVLDPKVVAIAKLVRGGAVNECAQLMLELSLLNGRS